MVRVKEWLLGLPGYTPREYVDDAIRLDLNESPYPPPKEIIEAIIREASSLNRYPEARLYRRLSNLISNYTGLPVDSIVLGAGGDGVLAVVFNAAVSPGSKVVIPSPSFPMYSFYAKLMGARLINVRLKRSGDRWYLDVDELVRYATDASLLVIDWPNNPTGAMLLSRSEIRELVGKANGIVVVDEAYYEFAGESVADLVLEYDNLVVVRTLSKAFSLAGLRVGYGLANPVLAGILRRISPPFSISRLSLAAAIAALENTDYVRRVVGIISTEREKLRRSLTELGLKVYPSKTNFLLVETNIDNVIDRLMEERIYVRRVPLGSNWFRVTVGTPNENLRLIDALGRLIGRSCEAY